MDLKPSDDSVNRNQFDRIQYAHCIHLLVADSGGSSIGSLSSGAFLTTFSRPAHLFRPGFN